MILSFKKQYPEKIIDGYKIHTIRLDPTNRWKAGKKIHFATGVRTKHYHQFMSGECKSVQKIKIRWPLLESTSRARQIVIHVDGKRLKPMQMLDLARKDGFHDTFEFAHWFNKDFEGKIIHWTDYRYN